MAPTKDLFETYHDTDINEKITVSMPAALLTLMCQAVAAQNVDRVDDLGELPYELAKPILRAVKDGHHLARLEEASPQLLGQLGPEWETLIKRTFSLSTVEPPSRPEDWKELYHQMHQERQARSEAAKAKLKAASETHQAERAQNSANYLQKAVAPKASRGWGASSGSKVPSAKGSAMLRKIKSSAQPTFSRSNPSVGPRTTAPALAATRPITPASRPAQRPIVAPRASLAANNSAVSISSSSSAASGLATPASQASSSAYNTNFSESTPHSASSSLPEKPRTKLLNLSNWMQQGQKATTSQKRHQERLEKNGAVKRGRYS